MTLLQVQGVVKEFSTRGGAVARKSTFTAVDDVSFDVDARRDARGGGRVG